MLLEIVWVVLFILWAAGGWWVYTESGVRYRGPYHVLLAILMGILAWVTFQHFAALK